jgi:hypothetical protein
VGVGRFRIETDGRIEVGDGARVIAPVAPLPVGKAAVVVIIRFFRIELDRFGQIGDGAGVVAFVDIGAPAHVERQRVLGIELDRLAEVGDGAVEIALVRIGDAAIEVGVGQRAATQAAGFDLPGAGGDRLVAAAVFAGRCVIGRGARCDVRDGKERDGEERGGPDEPNQKARAGPAPAPQQSVFARMAADTGDGRCAPLSPHACGFAHRAHAPNGLEWSGDVAGDVGVRAIPKCPG